MITIIMPILTSMAILLCLATGVFHLKNDENTTAFWAFVAGMWACVALLYSV